MASRSVNTRLIRPSYGQVQGITHGRQVNATNTGIAKWGLTAADLTTGPATLVAGTTYYRKKWLSGLTIDVPNVTLDQCLVQSPSDLAGTILRIGATGATVRDTTVFPSSGSLWNAIDNSDGVNCTGLLITGVNAWGCENILSMNDSASSWTVIYSYFHDAVNIGHSDCVEVYGGTNVLFSKSRITHPARDTAAINVAPWSGPSAVNGIDIFDCFLDGGSEIILVDAQSRDTGGYVRGMRILRNAMGGHQNLDTGRYNVWSQSDGQANSDGPAVFRPRHETQAQLDATPNGYLMPSTGPDVNRWEECSDLSPDLTGQIAL